MLLQDYFDLDKVLQLHEEEMQPPKPEPKPDTKVEDAVSDSQETARMGEDTAKPADIVHEAVPKEETVHLNVDLVADNQVVMQMLSEWFPKLVLPPLATDSFNNVAPSALQSMFSYASARASLKDDLCFRFCQSLAEGVASSVVCTSD